MNNKPKLLRITTVPISLHKLLEGQANYFEKKGFEVVLASADGKEIEAIEKETGLTVQILPLTRTISPIQDLIAVWKAYKLIKKEQPDIIHTHTPKAGIVGMLAAKFARVPIRMHTIAGLPLIQAKGIKRKMMVAVEKITSWAATNVYPNSFALQDFILTKKLAPKHKLKVLANGSSNGINTTYFDPKCYKQSTKKRLKEQLKIDKYDLVFTFIGRLVSDKGINELIDAFKQIHQTNIKLLLVGEQESKLDPLTPKTTVEIQNNKQIISTGWVEDVRPYLSISDVFVFPSYREGMPNVVLQASAMGLPQIVTDINGSNEIITHEKNGLIIPIKDTVSLFSAMQQMLDPDLRKKMRKNARQTIIDRFEQTIVWEALLAEYKRTLRYKSHS